MNTVLITCGTSLLTNINRANESYSLLTKNSNKQENELFPDIKQLIDKMLSNAENKLNSITDNNNLKNISAEFTTLFSYYKSLNNIKDCMCLLCTDTYIGKKCAEIIETFFRNKYNANINLYCIKSLRTDSYDYFKEGLNFLHQEDFREIYTKKNNTDKVIFILSGGFKAWSGYMQAIGMLYADEVVYQFERTEDLFKIPKIPLKFDFNENQKQTLRKLAFERQPSQEELSSISDAMYFQMNNEYCLEPFGKMCWNKIKDDGFYLNLQNPLNNLIEYSPEFKRQYANLTDDEKNILGEKLDNVAMFLETNDEKYNLRSIRWHRLENHEFNYEFYPFNGNMSPRCYLKQTGNNKFNLVRIGPHSK